MTSLANEANKGHSESSTNGSDANVANDASKQTDPGTEKAATVGATHANPYFFPEFTLPSGVIFNGVPVMRCPVKDDPLTHIKKIRALALREDDIIITAYPKCGTHWVSEILHMLTSGVTSYCGRTKEFTMLEFVNDLPALETYTSPRLLNSHLFMAHLPEQVVEKQVKLVHVIRNPKDTAVSMYHHLRQSGTEQFTWDNFLKGYTTDGYFACAHQFSYLRQMDEFEKAHPNHPIKHVHYEDLKRDAVPIIQDLSRYLGVTASEAFCQEVAHACGFDKMKQADQARDMPESLKRRMPPKLSLYRKGIIGDWKNTFTVAQNEMFDEFISNQAKSKFTSTFRDH